MYTILNPIEAVQQLLQFNDIHNANVIFQEQIQRELTHGTPNWSYLETLLHSVGFHDFRFDFDSQCVIIQMFIPGNYTEFRYTAEKIYKTTH